MIDVCLLGTGGMQPLPNRFLTSLMLRYNGHSFLVDCGESTQTSIRLKGWSFKDIDVLLFTHLHADHIAGLPGLLLAMNNSNKTNPLTICGPKHIKQVVNSLRIIAPEISYPIEIIELTDETPLEYYGLKINPFKVNHSVTCYGYSFELKRLGKFLPDTAKALNIPVSYWNKLQHGEIVDGFTPEMVMTPERKGIKLTYCTDTRPCSNIYEYAKDSDLFICEGMYGDNDTETKNKAKTKYHMLMQESVNIAAKTNVKELWLTHFSPSMVNPKMYEKELKKVFKNTNVAVDRQSTELNFEGE